MRVCMTVINLISRSMFHKGRLATENLLIRCHLPCVIIKVFKRISPSGIFYTPGKINRILENDNNLPCPSFSAVNYWATVTTVLFKRIESLMTTYLLRLDQSRTIEDTVTAELEQSKRFPGIYS